MRMLYPADERLAHFSAESRAVVSEPLVALPGLWHEVPAGSALIVEKGSVQQRPFTPREPG
jgi:predicted glutamine amidotransferase